MNRRPKVKRIHVIHDGQALGTVHAGDVTDVWEAARERMREATGAGPMQKALIDDATKRHTGTRYTVQGETFAHRETLKRYGLRWDHDAREWHTTRREKWLTCVLEIGAYRTDPTTAKVYG